MTVARTRAILPSSVFGSLSAQYGTERMCSKIAYTQRLENGRSAPEVFFFWRPSIIVCRERDARFSPIPSDSARLVSQFPMIEYKYFHGIYCLYIIIVTRWSSRAAVTKRQRGEKKMTVDNIAIIIIIIIITVGAREERKNVHRRSVYRRDVMSYHNYTDRTAAVKITDAEHVPPTAYTHTTIIIIIIVRQQCPRKARPA